jgi:hypothetical protein
VFAGSHQRAWCSRVESRNFYQALHSAGSARSRGVSSRRANSRIFTILDGWPLPSFAASQSPVIPLLKINIGREPMVEPVPLRNNTTLRVRRNQEIETQRFLIL